MVSYFSLASGFLTGKYRSVDDQANSARTGFLKGYFDERGLKVLEALRDVSQALSATPAQVALAWLMSRPGLTAPIASATSREQLNELITSATTVLPAEAVQKLDAAGR